MSNPSETERLDNFDSDSVELRVRPRESEILTLRLPKTVLQSLGRVMVKRSMSSIEALVRFYIGKGLRQDLSQLFSEQMLDTTAKVLTRRFGTEQADEAMREIRQAAADAASRVD